MAWTGIQTSFGEQWKSGSESNKHTAFMAGSSLAGDGISWNKVIDFLQLKIEGYGVAGSSPAEWEYFQKRTAEYKMTFIVVSVYDLNEYSLCDFRANIVPFVQALKDLRDSRADWTFAKRLLSTYPLAYIRAIFPTAGRSDGVMVGVRGKLNDMLGKNNIIKSQAGPTLSFTENGSDLDRKREKISNWSPGRMLRRIASMRDGFQGKHSFNGPKKLALLRILNQAQEQGRVVVVVLPISPAYAEGLLIPEMKREFENTLDEIQHSYQQPLWIRLDQLDELKSNEYFWDLVHINVYGQKIATEELISQLKKIDRVL